MITEAIKELRRECHALVTSTENHVPSSLHVQDFLKSLKLGRAWMGNLLGIIGSTTPYKKDGERHSTADIEAVVDISPTYINLSTLNQVERIDWLRESLKKMISTYEALIDNESATQIKAVTAVVSIQQHLSEARFHLGFELGRIRDSAKE